MTVSKHLKANKRKSRGRRGGSHAKSLIAYLRKGDHRSHVEYVRFGGFNLASDQQRDVDVAMLEMMALADANPRCTNPLLHCMVSWPEHERPTEKQAQEAVQIVLAELGAEGLQHVYAAHVDTQNFHLHIVVNRLDPQTERPRRLNNGFHQEALLRASARIDAVQGWSRPKNAIYDLTPAGVAVRRDAHRRDDPARPSIPAGVRDQEIKTGAMSAVRVAQEQVAEILISATSWRHLHAGLAARGARYEKKGSGALVWIGDQPVKASAVSRKAALAAMVKRLGEYEPPAFHGHAAPDQRRSLPPTARPINAIAAALGWSEYRRERESFFQNKREAAARLAAQFAAERQQLFQHQAVDRGEISRRDWRRQGAQLNALRQLVAFEHAKAKAALLARQKEQRRAARAGRFPSFEEWVAEKHGRAAANSYRHPRRAAWTGGPEIEPGPAGDIRDYRAEVFGSNVRYFDHAGRTAMIDQGRRILLIDVSDEGTLSLLQLGQQRYGGRQHLTGPPEWIARAVRIAVENRIAIGNPELQGAIAAEQQRRRQAAERRRPPVPTPVPVEADDFVDIFSAVPEPVAPPYERWKRVGDEIPAEIPVDQPQEPGQKSGRKAKMR